MSERTPEDGQLCLVYAPTADPLKPIRHFSQWSVEGRWVFIVPYWSDRISHWMPYPDTSMLPH